jgi:hypothetical protein
MTTEFKSFAALKRAIHVGSRLRVIDHWNPHFIGTSRIVIKLQTNGFYFRLPGAEKWQNAWSPYPSAKQVSFPAPGRFRFDSGDLFWELEFEPDTSAASESIAARITHPPSTV